MKETEQDWKRVEQHELTGREIYQRTVEFRITGNNEGTMEDEIQVREADGTPIIDTTVRVEWEYYGYVQAKFAQNGAEVHVLDSNKESEILTLPPVRAKK